MGKGQQRIPHKFLLTAGDQNAMLMAFVNSQDSLQGAKTMRRFLCLTILLGFLAIAVVAGAQTPLSFIPIGPCRVADTRNPTGPFGGPALVAGTPRDFNIPQNPACSVPNTALAYSLNVTVVPNGNYLGYLTVWPAGQTQPVVSTLNSYDGRIKSNAVVVGAGASEAISVYATDVTDLVLDITGYWVGPSNPAYSTAMQFYPLQDPITGSIVSVCNLVNTQNTPGPLAGPALQAGVARDFPIQTGFCNIPPEASAYALNVTAIPVGGDSVGYVTVWPSSQAQPETSTLNATTGTTVSNMTVISTGGGAGDVSAYANADTNLLIDIVGYFAPIPTPPPPPAPLGLALYTVTPCRVLDTRTTSGAFTGQVDVNVQGGPCPLPPFSFFGTESYVFNATVLPTGGLGYFPIWPTGLPLPLPSNLYALDGAVTSNMALPFSGGPGGGAGYPGSISAFASTPTNLLLDLNGYFSSPSLVITTQALPAGTMNTPYAAFSMSAQGGISPYSWSGGVFPTGIKMTAGGTISGCPTSGTTSPTITVTDSASPPDTYMQAFTLTINPLAPLQLPMQTLPIGFINQPYAATIVAAGGLIPYTFSTPDPQDFPPGLSMDAKGNITGTPALGDFGNTYFFDVQVTDSECPMNAKVTQVLSITIN